MKNIQPPYSDEQIEGYIVDINNRLQKNNDIIWECEKALTDAGLLENKKKIEVPDLTSSEKELFEAYERLKKSQTNLQVQLDKFEAYLSIRGA